MKLKFELNPNPKVINVQNQKNEYLGEIGYYEEWKCWIWSQENDIVMSADCLQQVVDKIKELDSIEVNK